MNEADISTLDEIKKKKINDFLNSGYISRNGPKTEIYILHLKGII